MNYVRIEITLLGLLQIVAGLFLFDGLGQKVLTICGLFLITLGFILFRQVDMDKKEDTTKEDVIEEIGTKNE